MWIIHVGVSLRKKPLEESTENREEATLTVFTSSTPSSAEGSSSLSLLSPRFFPCQKPPSPPTSSSPHAAASVRFCFSPTILHSKELAAAHFFPPFCSFVCQQRCRHHHPKTGSPLLSSLPPSGHASSSFQCCCRLHSPAPPTFPILSRLLHRILPSTASSYRQCRCFPSFPPASFIEFRRRRRLPFLLCSSSPPRLSFLAATRVVAVFFLCSHQLAFTSFLTASPTPSLPP